MTKSVAGSSQITDGKIWHNKKGEWYKMRSEVWAGAGSGEKAL